MRASIFYIFPQLSVALCQFFFFGDFGQSPDILDLSTKWTEGSTVPVSYRRLYGRNRQMDSVQPYHFHARVRSLI